MILKKKRKHYEAPSEGPHLAVLADIEDLHEKATPWGQQDQLRFRWFVQQVGKDGKLLSVITTYNNSLNENSNLVQVITDLIGTPPDDGFETETLIGTNARIVIKHHKTQAGNTFPKIAAILPTGKGDAVLQIPAWYKRSGIANNVPSPASAPTKWPGKATTQASNPVASAPTTPQTGDSDLPPEPGDLDACDNGTSFPGVNATPDENAA